MMMMLQSCPIASAGDVTEADPGPAKAVFNVTNLANSNDSIDISYTLTETIAPDGDFIASANEGAQTATLDFSTDKQSARLEIDIESDTDPEASSTVTVTLNDEATPGTNYYVHATNNSDSLVISDDDTLILTIADVTTPVVESAGMVGFCGHGTFRNRLNS